MSRRKLVLDAKGFEEACDEIVELVAGLRTEHRELRRRQGSDSPDGYPPRSLGGGSRPSTDADGELLPPHGDPTGELVSRRDERPQADPVWQALEALVRHTHEARRRLEQAGSAAAQAHPPAQLAEEAGDRSWCWVCARQGVMTPTYRDSGDGDSRPTPRCRHCYDWWLASGKPGHRTEQPAVLIKARARGDRITAKLVEQATQGALVAPG